MMRQTYDMTFKKIRHLERHDMTFSMTKYDRHWPDDNDEL